MNTEPEMTTPTTPCCVFISYSSADRVMAEQLQRDLEGLGLDVWRDQPRLELDWSSEISRALVDIADVICLLWTPAAAASKWVQHEWLTARAVGKWIIPCLFPNGPALPPALSHVHGIVIATGVVIADAVAARIRQVRPRDVAYDYALVPPGVDIPFGHNPGFVGGRRVLAELYRSMVGNLDKAAPGFAGIVGMAGAGKTQLAIEFAVRFGFAFESVLWLPAGGPERWFDSLVGLAKAMYTKGRLKLQAAVGTGSDLEFFVALRRAFDGNAQTLLIVDNVADPRMLASSDVLPGTGCTMLTLGASVLFTTRSDFDLAGVNRHKLDMLSEPEALRLLTRSRLPTNDAEVRSAADICNVMGYLPLALVLADGLLRWRTDMSYADYLAELARDRLDTIDAAGMASEALATRHEAVIRRTLNGQLAALEGDPMAGHLLRLVSLFAEAEVVPLELLGRLAGIAAGPSKLGDALASTLGRLRSYSLLEPTSGGSGVRLHPLLRAALRALVGPEEERALKGAAAQHFADRVEDFRELESTYLRRGVDELLLDVATAVGWGRDGGRAAPDLLLLARVLSQGASSLRRGGELRDAAYFSQQMALRAVQFGDRDLQRRAEVRAAELGGQSFTLRWARGPAMPSLLRSFSGPEGEPARTRLSIDGILVATADRAGRVAVWHTLLGLRVHELAVDGHTRDIEFIGPTHFLAVATDAESVVLWDALSARRIMGLTGHPGGARSLAASPDGERLVVACGDGTVRLWQLREGSPVAVQVMPLRVRTPVIAVGCGGSRGQRRALMLHEDGSASITDLDAEIDQPRTIACGGGLFVVSSAGDYAAFWGAGQDGRVGEVWNLVAARQEGTLRADHPITAVAVAADAGIVVIGEFFGTLTVANWPAADTGRRLLGSHGAGCGAGLAIQSQGSTMASIAFGEIRIWNAAEVWPQTIGGGHVGAVSQLDRWADKPWFVSASWDGSVKVWMLDDGRLLRDLVRSEGRHRIDVVSAGDGTAIAAGPLALTIWDLASAKAIRELGHSAATRIRQSSDPARIVMVTLDGRVSTTDEEHGTRQVGLHGAQLVALAMVGGGRHALTGAGDGTVVRWDLDAAREDERFRMHDGAITDIVANPATDTVVSGSRDGTVKCWSWRNPTQVLTLAMDGIAIEAVAVDPGGTRVVAAAGATLRIWSLPLGQPLGSCVLWDRLTALLMPAADLLVAGDVSGNLYSLHFGHGRL